jgi:hypothetical protein
MAQRVSASPCIPRTHAVSRPRGLTVAALCLCGRTTASRSTRRRFLLLPLVFAFVVYRSTETVPSISPVSAKSAGALEALRNTGLCAYAYVKGAGRTLETPGSIRDLIPHSKDGHSSREIDAAVSLSSS